MSAKELYEKDFFQWAIENAHLLRAGRFDEVDIEHVAEEIEDMSKRERRELESRLEVLLAHLIKWQVQRERRGTSWRATIAVQRRKLRDLLEEMPSLRSILLGKLGAVYEGALLHAVAETNLPQEDLPADCPFTLEQILDPSFFPE